MEGAPGKKLHSFYDRCIWMSFVSVFMCIYIYILLYIYTYILYNMYICLRMLLIMQVSSNTFKCTNAHRTNVWIDR